MRRILVHRPSAAMVVAVLALIVALGGGAYAAIKLPANSVGSKQLKNNAVTSQKVKDRSLLAKDFTVGQLPRGAQGPQGPQGVKGDAGATGQQGVKGDTGPSDVYEAESNAVVASQKELTLAVPPGSYAVVAKARAYNQTGPDITANCVLSPSDGFLETASEATSAGDYATLTAVTAGTYSATTTIAYSCFVGQQLRWLEIRILATKVGAVH